MSKKTFPGDKQCLREQRRRAHDILMARTRDRDLLHAHQKARQQEYQKQCANARRAEFLKNIGPSTRLLIVRRGVGAFVTAMLMGFGCAHLLGHGAYSEKSYTLHDDTVKYTNESHNFDDMILSMLVFFASMGVALGYLGRGFMIAQWSESEIRNKIQCPGGRKSLHASLLNETIAADRLKLHVVCKSVLENMASMYPELFEELIATDMVPRDYAISVIRGHLKSHPDDFKRVLDVYRAETLPKSLMRKYGALGR